MQSNALYEKSKRSQESCWGDVHFLCFDYGGGTLGIHHCQNPEN